jgi:AbrB family looped-hinge helix DNA binding protein
MALAQSRVTAQGQISFPVEVRRKLGIGPGSVVEWDEEGDAVVVRKAGRYYSGRHSPRDLSARHTRCEEGGRVRQRRAPPGAELIFES